MKSKLYTGLLLGLGLLLIFSCKKDLEELNKDPHGFTTASSGSLFNGLIESLKLPWDEQFYINNEILYKQTQLAALTNTAWANFTIGTEAMWGNYYLTIPNIRELEKRFDTMPGSGELNNMKAMVKIIFAYKTFKLSDIFGDMPFFNAGYGFQDLDYLHPEYDSQQDIYFHLLNELKWCDSIISDTAVHREPFLSFSEFDKLFNGNVLKWQKFANSLRLRYAIRMSEKEQEHAGDIVRDVIENDRPVFLGYNSATYAGESASLWPVVMGFKNPSVSWSFREHEHLRMGSNIWHQFSENDSSSGTGIFDPRVYIFFETNNADKWAPYPQLPEPNTLPSGGIPYDSHRDGLSAYQIKGENCIYSPFNYFIVYDVDFMPIPLFTGAEVHFLKAEAYFRGIGVAMDQNKADDEYLNGLSSSVQWWMSVAEDLKLPLSGLTFPDVIQIPNNLNIVSVQEHFGFWNASSDEEKLEFIYTQRWLDAFRQPWEAYALTRRTGKTPREGDPINHFRLPYPPSEVEYNSVNCAKAVSNQGGDAPEVKLWWIP